MRRNPFTKEPVPESKPRKNILLWPFRFLGRILKGVIFTLGLMTLLSLIFIIFTATNFINNAPTVSKPHDGVLYLELKDGLFETSPLPSLSNPFGLNAPTVGQMVRAIDKAAMDPTIHGLVARLYDGTYGLAQIQEIRAAVKRFRDSGKMTAIYADSYGGSSGGMGQFYLASAFQNRWMQPMGLVSITGIRAEVPFIKPLLDKIGITPQFIQKKGYKTAYESVMRGEISDQNKAMLTDIVNTMQAFITQDIAKDLDIDKAIVESLINRGLFVAEEAAAAELVTHVGHPDQLTDMVLELLNKEKTTDISKVFVPVSMYAEQRMKKFGQSVANPDVALVYVSGAIMSGNGDDFPQDGIANADIIAPAILDAAKNPAIKTIILRVDSPGGSPIASETILRAVRMAKDKDKTVYVSMGNTAASGGYWVSAYADRIFAQPTTLTGSIGVVGGKIALPDLWEKIGVSWNTDIQWGDMAGTWSPHTVFSDNERASVDRMLTHVYDSFIERVSQGRGLSLAQVEAIAQGRVWMGAQAVRNGLVDELGGYQDVLNYTADQMGLNSAKDLRIEVHPKPVSFPEQILQILGDSGMVMSNLGTMSAVMKHVEPVAQSLVPMTQADFHTYEPFTIQ